MLDKVVPKILAVVLVLLTLAVGCKNSSVAPSSAPTSVSPSQDYLSVLEDLTVGTTDYHPEVMPPPLGTKFPPPFYEPILIGRIAPSITGSVLLAPYGQDGDWDEIELQHVRGGQTLDILYEATKPVLFLEKPDVVSANLGIGSSVKTPDGGLQVTNQSLGVGAGLSWWSGFFWEGAPMAELQVPEKRYSTALRVIVWPDGNLKLYFKNFSPSRVEVSYIIWEGSVVPDFINYLTACEKYWESGEVPEEKALKVVEDMKTYLLKRRILLRQ